MENKSSALSRKRMCVRTHFQEEIIIEILSRLPVKSLLRFKCVSKSWNKLISEPYFKRKHLDHANNGNSRRLLITPVRYENHSFSSSLSSLTSDQTIEHAQKLVCPSNIQPWGSEVCCYCDGLFCIKPWKKTAESVEEPSIWNPSTRESKLLPLSELPPKNNADYTYGLGYDPTCDDYKVIKVPRYSDSEIEILALKSDSWRKFGKLPYKHFMSRLSRLAFVNGGFHWLARHHRGISEKHSLRSVVLISVNISNGMYGEVPLPKPFGSVISKVATRSGLVVLRGMLCLYYNHWFEKTFSLWEMKEYGVEKSWTKMFSIPYIQLTDMVPRYMFEDGELLVYGLKSNGSALRTSEGASGLRNRKWGLVLEGGISIETFFDGYVYVESLISPKGF